MIVLHAAGNEKIGLGNLSRVNSLAKYLQEIEYDKFLVIFETSKQIADIFMIKGIKYYICKNRIDSRCVIQNKLNLKINEKNILITDLVDMSYEDNKFYRKNGFGSLIQINDSKVNEFFPDIYINSDAFKQEFKINKEIKVYSGSKYLIIKDDVIKYRPNSYWNNKIINKVLVCFGGSDPGYYTEKLVEVISNMNVYNNYKFSIILGPGMSKIRKENILKNKKDNIKLYINETNMASKIVENDLVITLGGLTTYEALFLGVPVACVGWKYMAYYVKMLSKEGLVYNIGESSEDMKELITCLNDIKKLNLIAKNGFEKINSFGAENIIKIALDIEK